MTEAESCIAELDQALFEVGEPVTLQKIAVDADGAETITLAADVRANVRASKPQDLEASDVTDIDVILSPTGLEAFGIPTRDDRLILGTTGMACNILNIAPIFVTGTLARIDMKCRG